MAGAFAVGAIVSELKLDKKGWDASVKSVEKDQKTMANFAKKNGEAMKKMGKSMAIAGGVIVGSLGLMVKSAVGFNKEMANVATLIPGQSERINELKKNVQGLAMAYGKSTTDISSGLYQVVSAFGDTSDTAKVLEINVKAAAAGMATTTDAINLTSAVTKAYGDTNAAAVQKVSDLAFQTVKLGQTTFPELASSIGRVTPLAKALNVSQEELFTTFATLTGVTGKASMVSTQFAGILGSMVKPTEGMGIAMSKLGKEIGLGADATAKAIIKELGFKDTLEGLQRQTDGTMVGLGKLFESKEALVALLPLLSSQTETYDQKLKAMSDSVGISDEAFKEISEGINSAGFNMERLKQTVTVLAQKLGDKLAPTIGKIVVSISKIVTKISDWIEKHPKLTGAIIKMTAALGAMMLVLGPLLMILPKIVSSFVLLKKLKMYKTFLRLTAQVKALGAASFKTRIQVGGLGKAFSGLKKIKLASMLGGAKGALGGVKKAFIGLINPVTATIAIFAATIFAVVKLIKAMKGLKKAREEANKSIKRNADVLKIADEKLRKVAEAAGLTAKEYENLKKKYDDNVTALQHAIHTGKEGVKLQEALRDTAENLTEEIETQAEATEELADVIEEVIEKEKDWISYIKSVGLKTIQEQTDRTNTLENVLEELDRAYKNNLITLSAYNIAVRKAKDELRGFSETVINTAVPAARNMAGVIEQATGEMEDDVKDFGETAEITFVEVKNYTDQLIEGMGNAFGSFVGNILTKGTSLKDSLKGLWGDIKSSFIGMIADIAKDWAIGFVKKIITGTLTASKAMQATDKVFQSVGKSVSSIGKGIGELISGIAKGIGTAIETLATSIANAARSLAAAAPQLLIVGAVALALFAGFKAIQSLFGGGGGKAKDKATEMLQDIRNKTYDIFNGAQWMWKSVIGEQQLRLENLNHKAAGIWSVTEGLLECAKASKGYLQAIAGDTTIASILNTISDFSKQTASNTKAIVKAIGNLPKAATGAYFPEPTLAMVGEVPEIAAPIPVLKEMFGSKGGGPGGKTAEVNINVSLTSNIQTLDPMTMRDVVRDQIEPQLLEAITSGVRKTPWRQLLLGGA